jgi:hypothetical protein
MERPVSPAAPEVSQMTPIRTLILAAAAAALLAPPANAQSDAQQGSTSSPTLTEKLNAYVGCINRLSERSFDSRKRYFSWVGKKGPTGRERIIYGTYTIYDTSDCRKNVEKANALEPRDPELEAAATAYVEAVTKLEPLLKEADDYYQQEDYKDDRMAKGRTLHPKLVAAWDAFAAADKSLRSEVEAINDRRALQRLVQIEEKEGRKARYHVEAMMIQAKRVMRANDGAKPDLVAITKAIADYEAIIKSAEELAADNPKDKVGSMFVSNAKSFLTTAKQLMRRIRDKVPYSQGDRMMLGSGGGWMVEGSLPRLMRDYNQLVQSYNSGARI